MLLKKSETSCIASIPLRSSSLYVFTKLFKNSNMSSEKPVFIESFQRVLSSFAGCFSNTSTKK